VLQCPTHVVTQRVAGPDRVHATVITCETPRNKRLFDAHAKEVARVDHDNSAHNDNDGILTFVEADFEGSSDGGQSNHRLFLPPTVFNRFAVTREINDGLLAPRLAPSQRAWVLSGSLTSVSPAVPASAGRDGDDRIRRGIHYICAGVGPA
jgi:hypothetical protein